MTLFSNPSLYPKAAALPAGWTATGCKVEASSGRTLNGYSFSSAAMTQTLCINTCASKNYSIAGIEYAKECYCQNSYQNGGGAAAPETDCNMFCSGDAGKTTICGGGSRLTTFSYSVPVVSSSAPSSSSSLLPSSSTSASSTSKVGTAASSTSSVSSTSTVPSSSAAAPVSTDATYLGCFQDNSSVRQLATRISTSNSMTNKRCNSLCGAAGYAYAGTQYYNEVSTSYEPS